MTRILSNLISAENYKIVITILGLAVSISFLVVAFFKNRKLMIRVIATGFMTVAAFCFVASIFAATEYVQSDVKQTVSDYTNNLLDSYAVDSSFVEINVPV